MVKNGKKNGNYKKELKEANKRISELEKQVSMFSGSRKINVHEHTSNRVRFGLMGDTHLGNVYEEADVLHDLYNHFQKEGVKVVYHTGDMCDGERMYRGHTYDLHKHGADAQAKYAIEVYPDVGIKTYFITGNHDLSFWRNAGVDIGDMIAKERKDLIYLGQEEADIKIGGKHKVRMNLFHPAGGTAYAISYHMQKIVESFSGGKKPHVLAVGHYHKTEFLPKLRNVAVFQTGTICSQTPFMKRKKIEAHVGGWIVDVWTNKKGLDRIKGEFIPYFE